MQALEVTDFEIERRLDAFARARLSPDPQATARARARIMREARLQFDAARIATHIAPVAHASRRSPLRRVAMPLLAASLWLGIAVGSISAAQPGGPLYTTRLWVENATLPASGAARANAELERLDVRLAEAMGAAAHGDANALAAAIDAYRQIADDALAAAMGDAALEGQIAAALDQHEVVLTAVAAKLESKGNTTAAAAAEAAIARAISHNRTVVDRLESKDAGNGAGGSVGSGAGAGGGEANGAENGNAGGGSAGSGSGGGTGGTGGASGGAGGGATATTPPSAGADPTDHQGGGPGGNAANSGSGGSGPEKPHKSSPPAPDPTPTENRDRSPQDNH